MTFLIGKKYVTFLNSAFPGADIGSPLKDSPLNSIRGNGFLPYRALRKSFDALRLTYLSPSRPTSKISFRSALRMPTGSRWCEVTGGWQPGRTADLDDEVEASAIVDTLRTVSR